MRHQRSESVFGGLEYASTAVFQPAEETAAGAKAMIDDGLPDRFPKPDVVLGQHVMPVPAGGIGTRSGVLTSAADSFEIRMFGRGAHGSMPEASVDPVVTVGVLQAGTKENVIPDEAVIKLNVRPFDEGVRSHVLEAIKRIVGAEAEASGAPRPPEITPLDRYQLVRNDPEAAERVRSAFRAHFGEGRVADISPISAGEDFGSFGSHWHLPSVFWTVGGTDPDTYREAREAGRLSELPTNHNPRFAPVIHPTLERGGDAGRRHHRPAPAAQPARPPRALTPTSPPGQEGKRMEPHSSVDLVIEDMPGIGRRYEMTGTNGGRVIVIIAHSGHRIVHGLSPGADQASAVELTDQQARKLGAILGGAFFKPAVVEELEAVFGNLLIDWVTLDEASPGAGKTIGELQIRRRTGVTIVAIVRDTQAITVPEPSETLRAGDRLVIIGRHQDSGPFHKLVVAI